MLNRFLVYILLVSTLNIYAQNSWVRKDTVNGDPRGSCVSFVVEGECFIATGRTFAKDKRNLYSYDPFQDDWDKENDLGGTTGEGLERSSAVAFTIDRKAYVSTGKGVAPFLKDLWEFDPETRVWSQKANFSGSPRRQAVAFSIDSFGYVGTGEADTAFTNDFWKYNPIDNQWSEISPFKGVGRKSAIAFSIDGKGYVGTGYNGKSLNDFWEYNPFTDEWIRKSDFAGTARHGATAFNLKNKGYIATGYDSTANYKSDVWEYNSYSNNWRQQEDIPGSERAFATSFVLRDIAYIGTGFNGKYLNDFYANENILSLNNDLDEVNIRFNNEYKSIEVSTNQLGLYIQLFDLTGKKLFESTLKKVNSIDLSNYDSSIIVYRVYTKTKTIASNKLLIYG